MFCEAGTPGRGFSCYPAGGTVCVCFQPSTEKALYSQYTSVPTVSPSVLRGFCRWLSWCGPLMIQWWENCCCTHISFMFLFIHSCRYAQYLRYSLIINCNWGLCVCWEHVLLSCQYASYCSPLCVCNYNQCFEWLWMKTVGRGCAVNSWSISAQMPLSNTSIEILQRCFLSPHRVLTALCQPTEGFLKITLPASSALSLQMWTSIGGLCWEVTATTVRIVAIELAIGAVIAHRHFS